MESTSKAERIESSLEHSPPSSPPGVSPVRLSNTQSLNNPPLHPQLFNNQLLNNPPFNTQLFNSMHKTLPVNSRPGCEDHPVLS